MSSSAEPPRLRRIRASALWAAYGDALGFITEMADSQGVARRGAQLPLSRPVAWRRRIGGRFGPTVELPAGCTSDDTQLRLATCRSIRGDGVFDAETFTKIELPVWSSYALGAGQGSQEAAANLRRRDVSWATNFFEGDRSVYVNGGGNGAAMRIQPHVWAAAERVGQQWRTDVIANAICTHGHMRGILGALFHATCLQSAFETSSVPGPPEWVEAVESLRETPDLIRAHSLLDHLWLGLWEERSAASLKDAVETVLAELRADIAALDGIGHGSGSYGDAVEVLGAFRPDQRGSGTKTALLSAVAAWLFADDPEHAIRTCANRLGTDTDSIATMAGALLGATLQDGPDVPLADRSYIEREAERMWAISAERQTPSFPYPQMMTWTPPRSQLDCLGLAGDRLAVAGLGPALGQEEVFAGSGKNTGAWGWIDLWFGQRVLIKRRDHPKSLPKSQLMNPAQQYLTASLLDVPLQPSREHRPDAMNQQDTLGPPSLEEAQDLPRRKPRTLHGITDEIIAKGFEPEAIGRMLLELAERENGIELAGQYATILAKARLSRRDRDRRG